mmetsp:Transcript_24094/g.35696  ORF Transcript_24094/g.35696 Transcript_24094/m.35696 type:complete len:119 (+) Transcript_24094:109-465(+)
MLIDFSWQDKANRSSMCARAHQQGQIKNSKKIISKSILTLQKTKLKSCFCFSNQKRDKSEILSDGKEIARVFRIAAIDSIQNFLSDDDLEQYQRLDHCWSLLLFTTYSYTVVFQKKNT